MCLSAEGGEASAAYDKEQRVGLPVTKAEERCKGCRPNSVIIASNSVAMLLYSVAVITFQNHMLIYLHAELL